MDKYFQVVVLFITSIIFLFFVSTTNAGECCRLTDHSGVFLTYQSNRWCEDYCCVTQNGSYKRLECCRNPLHRANEMYRSVFCVDWFSQYIWVPILVGLILLILFIACGVCCCCWLC